MIEYTLKGLLLVALMMLHDTGLHLYLCIVVLCLSFPFVEGVGQAVDDMVKAERQRQR